MVLSTEGCRRVGERTGESVHCDEGACAPLIRGSFYFFKSYSSAEWSE